MKKKIIATLAIFVLLLQISSTTIYAITEDIVNEIDNTKEAEEQVDVQAEEKNDVIVEEKIEDKCTIASEEQIVQEKEENTQTQVLALNPETGEIDVPDAELKRKLDNNSDGIVTKEEAESITSLYLWDITDITGLEYAVNLTRLDINAKDKGKIANLAAIASLTKLKDIEINMGVTNTELDFNIFANLSNIEEIEIEYVGKVKNVEVLNTLTKLKKLEIRFDTIDSITDIDKIQDIPERENNIVFALGINEEVNTIEQLNKLKEKLETIKVESFKVQEIKTTIDLGEIALGEEKSISFLDIPFLAYLLNENCKVSSYYRNEIEVYNYSTDKLDINNETKIIAIKTDKISTNNKIELSVNGSVGVNVLAKIVLKYSVVVPGEKVEIQIPDEQLKEYLLKDCDLDNDGIITEIDLKNITCLNGLCNYDISDLTGLEKAINVETMELDSSWENPVVNLTPLTFMTKLEELEIRGASKDANWSALGNITSLKKLELYPAQNGAISNISFLGNLTNLEELDIWVDTFDKSVDYSVLGNLVNLKKLDIGGLYTEYGEETEYKSLTFLQNLTKLENVSLYNITADSLDFIENYNQLTGINLKNSKIKKLDLNIFNKNEKLSSIDISYIDEIINGEAINNSSKNIYLRLGLTKIDTLAQLTKINEGKLSSLSLDFNDLILNNNEEVEQFKTAIENIKINKVRVTNIYQKVNLGELIANEEVICSLKDISPLMNYYLEDNSKIKEYGSTYVSFRNTKFDDYDYGNFEVDNNEKTLKIKPKFKKDDNQDVNTHVFKVCFDSQYIGMYLTYSVVSPGDKEEEIEFNNNVLKNYLLENYDIDKNEKITDFDIKNITWLQMNNLDNLTGIEKLTYLKTLTVYGQFTDLTPLNTLQNLEWLSLYSSKLENIDTLVALSKLKTFNIGRYNYNIPYDGVNIDCSKLEKMSELKSIHFSCVKSVKNTEKFNDLEKIENLSFVFTNIEGIKDFDKIEDREKLSLTLSYSAPQNKPCTVEESLNFADMISKMKVKNYHIESFIFDVELNDVYLDEEKIIKFEDISPVVKSYMENKGNIRINYSDYYNTDEVIVDNEKKEIKFLYNSLKSQVLYMSFISDGGFVSNNLDIKFTVQARGDKEEVVEIPDESLRREIINNYDIDQDGKITDYELKNILDLGSVYNVSDLTGLEHATNLKTLKISFNKEADISKLSTLTKLEKLEVGGIYNNNSLAEIAKLKTLKELEINLYYSDYAFDLNLIYNNLSNLEKLCIYNYEPQTINGVQKLKNLNSLIILYPKDNNLSYLQNCSNLTTLNVRNINKDIDITIFNKITKLNELTLDYKEMHFVKDLDKISNNLNELTIDVNRADYYITTEEEQIAFINEINKVNIENLKVYIDIIQNAQSVEVNKNTVMKYEQISPILREILTPNTKLNKLANSGYTNYFFHKFGYNEENLYENDENLKQVTINAKEIGKYEFSISIYSSKLSCYIDSNQIIYINEGNKEVEANIPDANLKAEILRTSDVDKNGIISEFDLINLFELDVEDKGITDLTGLEYAKNLKYLYANKNKIRSIAPLMNCEKLQKANLEGNYITDITCMKNRKFNLAIAIGLMGNYIDFTNDSENLRVLKEEVAKDFGKVEEGLGYDEMITYFAGLQYHGTPEEVDKEVIFGDPRIKQKIIDLGLDTNKDGKLTRKELMPTIDTSFITGLGYYLINGEEVAYVKLDLSNMEITDLTGLEYFTGLVDLDLSYNNISNIEPLKYLNCLCRLNLSHNKIKDLSALSNYTITGIAFNDLDFSYNEITSIEPINNWIRVTHCYIEGWHDIDPPIRATLLNLSHNKITDISGVENWRAILNLDLSYNEISNISNLKNYDFFAYNDEWIRMWFDDFAEYLGTGYKVEINLSNNNINENDTDTKAAVKYFEDSKAEIILNKKEFSIEDKDSNVKIEASTEELPTNTKLNVEEVKDEEEKEEIKEALGEEVQKVAVFNIVLTRNNIPIEPSGKIIILIPIPEGFDKDNILVYRIEDDGTKIEYEVEIIGNYVKIETDHFSKYVVVEGNKYQLGDVNKDGKINALDATLILKYVSKKKDLTEQQLKLADVTKDGKVNSLDAVRILKYVAKKITEF